MNCLACGRTNPADAKFCIYCAAQLSVAAPPVQAAVTEPAPATGPTTRLEHKPTYTLPAAPPIPVPPVAPSIPGALPHYKEWIGAVFLIGLGLLFLTGSFFPGILVLIGITGFLSESGRGRQDKALQALVFFAGLAVLFWSHSFFPGILILIGVMALLKRRHSFCW
jgi:hypothetical protein